MKKDIDNCESCLNDKKSAAAPAPKCEHCEHCKETEPAPLGSCCGTVRPIKEASGSCCGMARPAPEAPKGGETLGCCGAAQKKESVFGKHKSVIFIVISVLALAASLLLSELNVYHNSGNHYIAVLDPAWLAVALCGYPIYYGAFYNLIKRKRVTSALLISIAITACLIMGVLMLFGIGEHNHFGSYFFAAGTISVLMATGSFVEEITIGKSRSAIAALIAMKPTTAHLINADGSVTDVPISGIKPGEKVLIKPNEIVSIDGAVVKGAGAIDASSITGEYTPQDVAEGDKVFAGTRNLATALEITATSYSSETTFSKLVEYVKKAEQNKAPIVRLADKWASYFVPFTVILSILVFVINFFVRREALGNAASAIEGVQRAITILIVVCPCALTLATPIAIAAGIGNASRKGILIKSGTAMEQLSKITAVCFDKTGTLTKGKLKVAGLYPYGISGEELLNLAAAAERDSEHPIARAITEYAGQSPLKSDSTESIMGSGVKAIIGGKTVEVAKIQNFVLPKDASLPPAGSTVIGVSENGVYKGALSITDTLKEDASQTIADLNAAGYKTIMLTGDNEASAKMTAAQAGITDYRAELLPEEKVKAITALKAGGAKVLMAGDGVNDAPSLATADCSLAMGALGSSVAIETADVSLMREELSKIPFLLRLSKKTIGRVKFNIALSFAISGLSVILSAFGVLDAVLGAFMHNISSALVSVSSALLLLYKDKKMSA